MHGKVAHVAQGRPAAWRGGTGDHGAISRDTVETAPIALLVRAARDELRMQRRRPLFEAPDIFDYQPWRLMIEVFVANSTDRRLSVTDACLVLGGPQTTALRCLAMIEKHGLLVSSKDPTDARRRLLRLSPGSERVVLRYLTDLLAADPRSVTERHQNSA